jgi:hypothetical protein
MHCNPWRPEYFAVIDWADILPDSATVSGFIGREELVPERVAELSSENKVGPSLSGILRVGRTRVLVGRGSSPPGTEHL